MAAYAALVSVMQIIHQIENHHCPPISLDNQQVESLTEKVNFLQEFLEEYNSPYAYSNEADLLEMRISYAAYAAEDAIESYILYNIKFSAEIADPQLREINGITFYEQLQKAIEDMDLIVGEVTEMVGVKAATIKAQLQSKVSRYADLGSISSERKSAMVGFDDLLLQLLHSLTGGESSRQIIPIVGMGGIGKTTLALNVFENQLIKEHFDTCVWATISQDYDIRETFIEVLSQVRGNSIDKSDTELVVDKSERKLGETIYKILCGQKYLIIMDDMWSLEVWDKMKSCFPDYNNGSRVMVTTRMSTLGVHLTDSNSLLHMKSLDEASSWHLFSRTVFGVGSFPLELEMIGKEIVNSCNGHPLAIVMIGGLLAKSEQTNEHWEHVQANLIPIVNSEGDEYCLRILRMSYNHLPVCLKPCFLYMGVFPEDFSIRVSTLVKLWVCEGFVKPRSNKTLETIAEEYFKELVDRNLIIVHKLGSLGNIKYCKIHDLLRDLCLKESRKQRLYYDVRDEVSGRAMISHRRITLGVTAASNDDICRVLELNLHVRSILSNKYQAPNPFPDFRRMLRILATIDKDPLGCTYIAEEVFMHANSRYLGFTMGIHMQVDIPSSINLLWNLHTLIIDSGYEFTAPVEIWEMRQLRHIELTDKRMYIPTPPSTDNGDIVIMENLHTLKGLTNFYLNEEVVKRIPNIKKLSVDYGGKRVDSWRVNCISYLHHLNKLESFSCTTETSRSTEFLDNINFPKSLKELKLSIRRRNRNRIVPLGHELEDLLQKIGFLHLLQKLVLKGGYFRTGKWETIEGQLPNLKVLKLGRCGDLDEWTVPEISPFPRLQELHLTNMSMKEIPSEIGEIATLKSIVLWDCGKSLVESAKKIVKEQEELHGEQLDLHVRVKYRRIEEKEHLQHLASPNFHIDLL